MCAKRAQGSARQAAPRDPFAVALTVFAVLGLVSLAGARVQAQAMDEGAVVLGLAGLVAAASLLRLDAQPASRSRLAYAWAAFLAWALVSAALSGRVWASLVGEVTNLLGWFSLAALTAVTMAAAARAGAVRGLLCSVAPIVVFGQTAATLVQLAMGTTPRGSLPNSTYLGEAVLLLLPFVLEADGDKDVIGRPQRVALAVSAVVTLAAAGSRVAAVAGMAWLVWALVTRRDVTTRVRVLLAAGLVVAVAAGGLLFARAEVLGSLGADTLGERPQMWRAATLAVEARPILGYGPDGFVAGGVAVTTPELARREPVLVFRPGAVDPHNVLAWVAVSTGVVGLALFAWALAELALAWRSRAAGGARVGPAAWAIGTTALVLLTAPLAIQVVPLMGLVLGVSVAPAALPHEEPTSQRSTRALRPAASVVLGFAALVLVLNAGTRLPLEVHGADVSPRLAGFAQAATDVWRFDPHLAHLASLHWGWVAASDRTVAARQPDLAAIERAVAVDSRDPFVALERARTLRFYGADTTTVERAFLAAFDRWELYPLARAEYAVLLAQAGRDAEAREQLEIARLVNDRDPDRRDAIAAAETELAR